VIVGTWISRPNANITSIVTKTHGKIIARDLSEAHLLDGFMDAEVTRLCVMQTLHFHKNITKSVRDARRKLPALLRS